MWTVKHDVCGRGFMWFTQWLTGKVGRKGLSQVKVLNLTKLCRYSNGCVAEFILFNWELKIHYAFQYCSLLSHLNGQITSLLSTISTHFKEEEDIAKGTGHNNRFCSWHSSSWWHNFSWRFKSLYQSMGATQFFKISTNRLSTNMEQDHYLVLIKSTNLLH